MNVLVNGIGNIGTTLLHLLTEYKELLTIERVFALKNSPEEWHTPDLEDLKDQGIEVCVGKSFKDFPLVDTVIDQVHYIFDCTSNGGGLKNKEWYVDLPNLIGASAQGSEKKFGKSFMSGVNDSTIKNKPYVHVVSCNTHAASALLKTLCGEQLDHLKSSDFVVVRRSEDIGNHQRLVSANVVARHLDDAIGTHHAIDLIDLYATIGILPKITSSDITTPSQLMHSVRFNIEFSKQFSPSEIQSKIQSSKFISTTSKFDSNVIFERGRRKGLQGRIYSHAIIVENNLLIRPESVKGWAFIPQEGNTLLSTIHAYLLQINQPNTDQIMNTLREELILSQW